MSANQTGQVIPAPAFIVRTPDLTEYRYTAESHMDAIYQFCDGMQMERPHKGCPLTDYGSDEQGRRVYAIYMPPFSIVTVRDDHQPKHTPKAELFDFICGWDYQNEADRFQVLADYYMNPPDDEVKAEALKDWEDVNPNIRAAIEDACNSEGQ